MLTHSRTERTSCPTLGLECSGSSVMVILARFIAAQLIQVATVACAVAQDTDLSAT